MSNLIKKMLAERAARERTLNVRSNRFEEGIARIKAAAPILDAGFSSTTLLISLSFPARELSPNARVHWSVRNRFRRAAQTEAWAVTKQALTTNPRWEPDKEPIPVHIIAHPKAVGPRPDADNLVSSLKGAIDGISKALGIDDRNFDAPTIEWGERCPNGKLVVRVG